MQFQKYHQTSPHRAQSIRMFSLIHQLNNDSSYTINANSIDKFVKSLNLLSNQDLVKFMHSIDKYDKEMRQYYWGSCLSKALKYHKIASEADYLHLNNLIKDLLIGNYVRCLQNYEMWDGNVEKSLQQKDETYVKIINTWREISMYINKIDFLLFTNNIAHINNCFSLLTLFPNKNSQIVQLYENILAGSFLQTLQFGLTTNVPLNVLVEMLKSLCYLYQSFRIQKIQKLLQQTFLVQPATLEGLLQNIADKRSQVRYYTSVLMGLMANNVPALATILLSNKKLLYQISNGVALIQEKEGLMFGVQFLIGVVKGFGRLPENEKKQNEEIINVYLKFAVSKLGQLESQKCQAACIRLVLQIVKATDLSQDNLKHLKFINDVFEGPKLPNFQPLFELTLQIAKYSIIFERKNVQNYITGDKSFESYIKKMLKQDHEQWQPFYSCLQVILLMASTPHLCDTLFQRDLIQCVFGLSQSRNGLAVFYVSEIILYLILNSLQSEWKITYLYEKDCLKTIGRVIANSSKNDIVLQNQYVCMQQISYKNRYALTNCLKALNFLTFGTGNLSTLKKEHYVKNFSLFFINSFSEGLFNFFSSPNRHYLQVLLKQEHSLSRNPNSQDQPLIKLYKLMSNVIEQMTMHLRKRSNTELQILKLVNKARNEFHTNLYICLNYNELVVESIPIYLVYAATINGRTAQQRVYRMSWNQYRSLMWEFIKKVANVEADYFRMFQKATGYQIKHEDDYRKILQKILIDYSKHNYIFQVEIRDIRQKEESPNISQGVGSMRMQQPDFRSIPRFMSYNMPKARDNSPFNSRRGTASQRNRGSTSPNFGTPCRSCNRPTPNRSGYCNECIQTYHYR